HLCPGVARSRATRQFHHAWRPARYGRWRPSAYQIHRRRHGEHSARQPSMGPGLPLRPRARGPFAGALQVGVRRGTRHFGRRREGCQAQALGPCGSSSARILSAEMGQLSVEFRAQFSQPEIKPLQGGVFVATSAEGNSAHSGMPLGRAAAAAPGIARSEPEGLPTTALAEGAVQAALGGRTAPPTVPALPPAPPITITPPPSPPVPIVASEPSVLQWGRWASAAAAQGDFSVSRGEAGEGRAVTVGNADYLLYRIENASGSLAPGLGSYQFSLDHAFAQYNLAGQLSAAAVEQGKLSIDFGAARVATDLRVNNALTGAVNISGSGFIRGDGIFNDRSVAGQAIAGATALDGKSAGYFFEKAVGAGTLSGITLWSRPCSRRQPSC